MDLQRAFGAKVCGVVGSAMSRWDHECASKCAYVYVPVGRGPECVEDLSKSVGRIHFAGDATDLDYVASMIGAYRSAERAAAEINLVPSTEA